MKKFNRMLAIVLTVCMVLSMVPAAAAAEESAKSDLPQVYITFTEPDYTPDMLQKGMDYIDCTIRIVDPTGEFEEMVDEETTIKVRGNSTSEGAKKPFNFKLSGKTDILGMGKGKKWSLLANMYDKSLMRNKLVFDLAEKMGMDYVSDNRTVDVWLDGKYNGTYTLCEPVEIGSTRVDIDEDAGEYIFESEKERVEEGAVYFTTSRYRQRFVMADPDEPTTEQVDQIKATLKTLEDAIATNNLETIAKYMDVQSFVDLYILEEYFKEVDVGYSSTKHYIKDGMVYAGPVWDFDLSSGNCNFDYYASYNNKYSSGNSYEGLYANNAVWYKQLLKNADFLRMLKERFVELQPMIVNLYQDNELGGNQIDAFVAANKDSIEANWKVWNVASADSSLERKPDRTYEANVEYLRNWLEARNDWMQDYYGLEHKITCQKNDLGSVEAADTALFSQSVTLKVTTMVDEGALSFSDLKKLTVTSGGAQVQCTLADTTENADGTTTYTYTFTMPDGDVNVKAEFELEHGSQKAKEVEALIDAIGTVTADSGEKIEAARAAYEALSYVARAEVSNYDTLTEAEAAFKALADTAKAAEEAVAELEEYAGELLDSCEEGCKADIEAIASDAKDAVAQAKDTDEIHRIVEEAKAAMQAAAKCPSDAYTDVNKDGWYHEAVDYMVENGYMNGVSKNQFDVDGTVTRGQLVTIVYRIVGTPSVTGKTNPFTDVPENEWYTDAVIWAAENGIVNGTTPSTFAPNAPVTREQLVTILYRYDGETQTEEGALDGYADAASVSAYAKDAFAWAVANGIVNGTSETTLSPAATATRAQICAIMMRYLSE